MKRKEMILTLCAHNDDQIIGAGGTMAKYAKQGALTRTIIFSFGESSHPHLKREVIVERRVKESLKADKLMGGKGIAYLGLKEGKFEQEFHDKEIRDKIEWLIKKEKPTKIFTHSSDDPHPDHRAVNKIVRDLLKKKVINCDVYEFPVWNLIKVLRRNSPKLVVDITDTFKIKIKSFAAHTSQKSTIWLLLWNIYLRARLFGLRYKVRYVEVFYKI